MRSRRGYTLVEVTIALAITAVIVAALATMLTAALRVRAGATAALDRTTAARLALAELERELATALPEGFRVSGTPAALRFTGGTDPGLRLAYELDGSALSRRAAPRFGIDDALSRRPIPLVTGVVALEVRAFDGEAWTASWSDLAPPRAVRVVLTLAGGETFESVVPIPTGREHHG